MEEFIEDDDMQEPESEIAEYFEKLFGEGILEETDAVDERNFALLIAVREGSVRDILRYLREGADIYFVDMYGDSALHIAARMGHLAVVHVLIDAGSLAFPEDMNLCSPLHLAAGEGHTNVVKALITAGASLEARDYDEETPLHYAARGGHAECLLALAAAGADLEAVESRYFNTPLHQAASSGQLSCVRALIKAGANVNAQNHFRTKPLHFAENPKILVALVRGGANVNARDWGGWTPLHRMVVCDLAECVRLILQAGANPGIRDRKGKKPMDLAKKPPVKALLRDYMY